MDLIEEVVDYSVNTDTSTNSIGFKYSVHNDADETTSRYIGTSNLSIKASRLIYISFDPFCKEDGEGADYWNVEIMEEPVKCDFIEK